MVDTFFWLFSLLLILSAMGVICFYNPIYSVLSLIISFVSSAGLMILMEADYIAMVLIIVYVGAIAIFFLFVIMMMAIDKAKKKVGFLTIALSLTLIFPLLCWTISSTKKRGFAIKSDLATIENIATSLYSNYILHLQIAGVILMIAMVGAIMLITVKTKAKKQSVVNQINRTSKIALINQDKERGVKL